MTIKEQVIRKSITEAEKQLKKVNDLLELDPVGELIKIRIEFGELLNEYKGQSRLSKEFDKKVSALYNREKQQKKIRDNVKKDDAKLIEQKVKLEIELGSLKNELYYIENRGGW